MQENDQSQQDKQLPIYEHVPSHVAMQLRKTRHQALYDNIIHKAVRESSGDFLNPFNASVDKFAALRKRSSQNVLQDRHQYGPGVNAVDPDKINASHGASTLHPPTANSSIMQISAMHQQPVVLPARVPSAAGSLKTESSVRSLPHLVPQRTNMLTGAVTSYYSNVQMNNANNIDPINDGSNNYSNLNGGCTNSNNWNDTYQALVKFQKANQKLKSQQHNYQHNLPPKHHNRTGSGNTTAMRQLKTKRQLVTNIKSSSAGHTKSQVVLSPSNQNTATGSGCSGQVTLQSNRGHVAMPISGAPVYLGERMRDAQIRVETMKQTNAHQKIINEKKKEIMEDAREQVKHLTAQNKENAIEKIDFKGEQTIIDDYMDDKNINTFRDNHQQSPTNNRKVAKRNSALSSVRYANSYHEQVKSEAVSQSPTKNHDSARLNLESTHTVPVTYFNDTLRAPVIINEAKNANNQDIVTNQITQANCSPTSGTTPFMKKCVFEQQTQNPMPNDQNQQNNQQQANNGFSISISQSNSYGQQQNRQQQQLYGGSQNNNIHQKPKTTVPGSRAKSNPIYQKNQLKALQQLRKAKIVNLDVDMYDLESNKQNGQLKYPNKQNYYRQLLSQNLNRENSNLGLDSATASDEGDASASLNNEGVLDQSDIAQNNTVMIRKKKTFRQINDVLIPRTILKRNNPGGLIKDIRLQQATEEYVKYQQEMAENKSEDESFEPISKYGALFGQKISPTNPIMSPRLNQIIKAQIRKRLENQRDAGQQMADEINEVMSKEQQDENSDKETSVSHTPVAKQQNQQQLNNMQYQQVLQPHPVIIDSANTQNEISKSQHLKRHMKVIETNGQKDGIFKNTGLEVVEHEFEIEENALGSLQQIRFLYRDGQLSEEQMEKLIQRHLKQQKIFAYGSYDEFFNAYFKRGLVCVEDQNKVNMIQVARKRYSNMRRRGAQTASAVDIPQHRIKNF